MKKFSTDIIRIDGIPPYLQVDFDGLQLDKDLVQTNLMVAKGVDRVNIKERGIDKYRALVYPTAYCDSLEELQTIIDDTLGRL